MIVNHSPKQNFYTDIFPIILLLPARKKKDVLYHLFLLLNVCCYDIDDNIEALFKKVNIFDKEGRINNDYFELVEVW